MSISRDDVARVAHLARIDLAEDELKLFARQLESIVEFIDKLKELDVSEIFPAHTPALENVLRPDTIKDSLSPEAALENAPKSLKGQILVPKVIE